MRSPLLHGLVGLWHFFPRAAHLSVELHLDSALVEIVGTHERQGHEEARESHDEHEMRIEVEVRLRSDELHGQEACVVNNLERMEDNRPQQVLQLVLSRGVALHV